jgi:cyclophilin family peptidyl-prolyl cis-trans isomerase
MFKRIAMCLAAVCLMTGIVATADEEAATANPVVVITTSAGVIEVELYADKSPITVENFLKYVDDKSYDGTIFHRVIKDFMVQGGGMTKDMERKPTREPIKNEATNGVKNDRGTIAMARTGVVDSATSQFFINHKNNDFLNHKNTTQAGFGYCAFGKVTKGMEVVDAIAVTPTNPDDSPKSVVVIESVRRK